MPSQDTKPPLVTLIRDGSFFLSGYVFPAKNDARNADPRQIFWFQDIPRDESPC